MFLKSLISKFIFFLIIGLGLMIFISYRECQSTCKKNVLPINTEYSDSIKAVRESIHATEKAQKLDILFKDKVKLAEFNGCVLVAQRGQIIYKNAFGYANLKTRDSLKINAAFQLASASKPLTAAAILLLKDQNKLNLDDNIKKYLPEFPYDGITIKMLLTHRSGLFNYIYACEPYCKKPDLYNEGIFNNAAMLDIIVHQKPAVYYTPGKKFEYCNTNYALLALIVEKVSNQSFADFMQEQIFKPLKMNDTWVHDIIMDSVHKNKTLGYNGLGKLEADCYADDVLGDKGVYSTVEDMLKWDQILYTDKLLKKETIAEAFTGYSNEHKGKRNYGYGWRLIDAGKTSKIVYHNGWWHGYNSLFFRRPADQTTIIILSNKYNRSAYQIQDILSIVNENSEAVEIEGDE